MEKLRILINEDMPSDAELLEHEIRKGGIAFISRRVDTQEGFLAALEEFVPDLIISDFNLPSFNGMQALALAREQSPFTLLDLSHSGAPNRLLFQKQYQTSEPLPERTPAGLAQAMSSGMGKLSSMIIRDIHQAVSAPPANRK